MKRLRLLLLIPMLAAFGCAHVHVACQDAGTTTIAVGGNTAGQQILTTALAVGAGAAKGAGFLAVAPGPLKGTAPTAQSQSFVDYNYLAAFGSDYASCTTSPPPTPPSTTIVTPGSPPQVTTVPSGGSVVMMQSPLK